MTITFRAEQGADGTTAVLTASEQTTGGFGSSGTVTLLHGMGATPMSALAWSGAVITAQLPSPLPSDRPLRLRVQRNNLSLRPIARASGLRALLWRRDDHAHTRSCE